MDNAEDIGIKFLEQRVEEGRLLIDQAVSGMQVNYDIYKSVERDTDIYQRALEAATRKSDKPYKRESLPTIQFTCDLGSYKPAAERETPSGADIVPIQRALNSPPLGSSTPELLLKKKMGKALDISNDSPTGVVRKIFISAKNDIDIDGILAEVPEGLSFEITRDLIYRILPRMTKRGEITRTGHGKYRYDKDFEGTEG